MPIEIKVKKLHPDTKLPIFAHEGDACADLSSIENYELFPDEIYSIKTGIAVEIPEGYEMEIRPRSGLASKNGISMVNNPGTIDSGYRGEIMVILINHSNNPFFISKGMRIAQAGIRLVPDVEYVEVDELSITKRGAGGLGSTGV